MTSPRFFFAVLFIILSSLSRSQITFQKTFGGTADDGAYSVLQTIPDLGYMLAGYTQSFGAGGKDVYVVKTDSSGNTQWSRTFGGTADDVGYWVQQSAGGGYIISGSTQSFGTAIRNIYLIRIDDTGALMWSNAYDGVASYQAGNCVLQTTSGQFAVMGWTGPNPTEIAADVCLLLADTNGNLLWFKAWGGGNSDYCYSGIQDPVNNNFLFASVTYNFGAGLHDHYLIAVDSSSNLLWTKTHGGNDNDGYWSINYASDGGYILAGGSWSFSLGQRDIHLVKSDSDGNLQWARAFGGSLDEIGLRVEQTTDGGFALGALTRSFGAGNGDLLLLKTDVNGTLQWAQTFGGSGSEIDTFPDSYRRIFQQTADGGYVIAGSTNSFGAGGDDVYLVKTDAGGNTGCNQSGINPPQTAVPLSSSSGGTPNSPAVTTVNAASTATAPSQGSGNYLCLPPTALFTVSDTVICAGDCVSFTDTSLGDPFGWQWTFPGGTPSSSVLKNPSGICYGSSGNYDVTLAVTNPFGSDTLTKSFYIQVNAPPSASVSPDTAVCKGDSAMLSASGGSSVSWSPAAGLSCTSCYNPSAAPAATTAYTATVTDSSGCQASAQVTVIVSEVIVSVSPDTFVCAGDSVQLPASGGVAYSWSPPAGLDNPNAWNPAASPSITTTYAVTVTDSLGCTATDSVTVTVRALPVPMAGPDTLICAGDTAQLSASGGIAYSWSPSLGLSCTGCPSPLAYPVSSTTYSVTVTDSFGCRSSDTAAVTVDDFFAAAGPDTAVCEGEFVFLYASGGVSYSWTPSAGLTCTNCNNPAASPDATTTYYVTITDVYGCSLVQTVTIILKQEDECETDCANALRVPNAFSPNGDGMNDLFRVQSSCVINFLLRVYNRWGQLLWETTEVTQGWDGKFNGKLQETDVYVFYLHAVFPDGETAFRKGDVTLVR